MVFGHEAETCDAKNGLLTYIGQARQEILLQTHGVGAAWLVEALIAACGRGIMVAVIADRSARNHVYPLVEAGIKVCFDDNSLIHTNLVLVHDATRVLFCQRHEESGSDPEVYRSLILIDDMDVVQLYRTSFLAYNAGLGTVLSPNAALNNARV